MCGEFASDSELSVSNLKVEGVVALVALGRVGGPLQLADEPLDGEPPIVERVFAQSRHAC